MSLIWINISPATYFLYPVLPSVCLIIQGTDKHSTLLISSFTTDKLWYTLLGYRLITLLTTYPPTYWFLLCVVVCVAAGVPLTLSNVMREVREVEDWWGEDGLGDWILIPESKREEIRQKFPDEMEQKKQLISHWINTDPRASWRRLILALDSMKEAKIADSIRSYAEPLTGM